VNWFRKHVLSVGYRVAPTEFLLKLELKRYANNTAKTYIQCFERFLNTQTETDLIKVKEQDNRPRSSTAGKFTRMLRQVLSY
jgi:integrase/recombinase XerD